MSSELRLSREFEIIGTLSRSGHVITGVISKSAAIDYYAGEYVITPSGEEQSLSTKNKYMSDDVTVEEIPFHKTTNPSGGYTVTIG